MEMMDAGFRLRRYAENEKEALTATADLLEAEGWCQSPGRAAEGGRCLSVALAEAVGCYDREPGWHNQERPRAIWHEVSAKILTAVNEGRSVSERFQHIVDWNDAPGRTKDDVVNVLRDVASTL